MMHGAHIGGQRAGAFLELVGGVDPKRVAIDLTHSQIWDASSVAALDSIQTKYREHGAAVTFTGLDPRSSSFHERLTGQLGA